MITAITSEPLSTSVRLEPLKSAPALGGLNSYISAVHRLPYLEPQEEVKLFEGVKSTDPKISECAVSQLALSHLRLVVAMSRNYFGYDIPQEDLVQAGNIGLLKAIKAFDLQGGARLSTYAASWVHSEMRNHLINNRCIVKTATTKSQRKLYFNLRSLKNDFKQKDLAQCVNTHRETLTQDQVKQVAKLLNVDELDVIEMEQRLMGGDVCLTGWDSDDSQHPTWGEEIIGSTQYEPTEVIQRKGREHLSERGVALALDALDPRSRRIVKERWLNVDDNGDGLTLHDLAQEFGVSAERIRQIEVKALVKIRQHICLHTSMVY